MRPEENQDQALAGLEEISARMLAALGQKEATVACGAVDGSPGGRRALPQICSEAEERACQYFRFTPGPLATLTQRTELRERSCPRRQALEQSRWAHSSERRRAAEARHIPADVLAVLEDSSRVQRRPALEAVERWAPTNKRFLVLCGPNQVGKTFAACTWIEQQRGGIFLPVGTVRAAMTQKHDEPAGKLWARTSTERAIVLDNFDRDLSEAMRARVEELIVGVHARVAKLIITTTLAPEQFLEALRGPDRTGGAAVSRLGLYGRIENLPEWRR